MKSIKGKKTIIPARPAPRQKYFFDHHIEIHKYWFDAITKDHSRFIEPEIISWEDLKEEKSSRPHCAYIYALDALSSDPKRKDEPTIYCFFIYYERLNMLWKADSTGYVTEIIQALKTEVKWEEYQEAKEDAEFKRKQLLRDKKQKSRKKAA